MILNVILDILLGIIKILLIPIDAIINLLIPNLSTYTQYIIDFFNIVTTYIGWGLSALGINAVIIGLVVSFLTFKLTAPAFVYVFKLMFKWYHTVKG